jgi:Fic family protein
MSYENIIKKKQELDALRPFPKAVRERLAEKMTIDFAYNSVALEGGSFTYQQVKLIFQQNLAIGGKSITEHLAITSHIAAFSYVQKLAMQPLASFSEANLLQIQQLVNHGGKVGYRGFPLQITDSPIVFPESEQIPHLLFEFCTWLKSARELETVELASEAHCRLLSIMPFAEDNHLVARLVQNLILLTGGYPPVIIKQNQQGEYDAAVAKYQFGGAIGDYQILIANMLEKSLDLYIDNLSESLSQKETLFKMAEFATEVGEAISTIRYWLKEGLITAAQTTENGYQLFSTVELEIARKIKTLKAQRYTLKEIKNLL